MLTCSSLFADCFWLSLLRFAWSWVVFSTHRALQLRAAAVSCCATVLGAPHGAGLRQIAPRLGTALPLLLALAADASPPDWHAEERLTFRTEGSSVDIAARLPLAARLSALSCIELLAVREGAMAGAMRADDAPPPAEGAFETSERGGLQYFLLHPYCVSVVRGLLGPLDDPKRAVRRAAVRVRNTWLVDVQGTA